MAVHHKLSTKSFPGFIESAPAYASLAVYFNPVFIKQQYPHTSTAFLFVKNIIESFAKEINHTTSIQTKPFKTVPVYYNGEDLEFVASLHQLTTNDVIQIHSGVIYHVFMNGYLPCPCKQSQVKNHS